MFVVGTNTPYTNPGIEKLDQTTVKQIFMGSIDRDDTDGAVYDFDVKCSTEVGPTKTQTVKFTQRSKCLDKSVLTYTKQDWQKSKYVFDYYYDNGVNVQQPYLKTGIKTTDPINCPITKCEFRNKGYQVSPNTLAKFGKDSNGDLEADLTVNFVDVYVTDSLG